MYKNLLNLLVLAVLLPSCNGTAPHISVVCEENNVGNCIVKWEMAPLIKGNVKVYASTNPNHIPEDVPVAVANISDLKMTVITTDPTQRYYYTLVFADKYRVKIATRNINIPGIQNFRDLGGYSSYPTQKKVHWGMLYRSAEIDKLKPCSRKELKNIGIRTIIDLRSSVEANRQSPLQQAFKVIHIPIPTGDMEYNPERCTGTENQERYCLPNRGADEPRAHQQLHQRIPPDFRYSAGQEQLSRRYPLLVGQRAHRHRIGTCACLPWSGRRHHHGRLPPQQRLLQHPGGLPIRLPASGTLARGHHHPLLGTRGFPECRHRRNGTKVWRYRHLPAKRHRSDKRRKKETARHSFNG